MIIDPNSLLVRTDKQPATVAFLNNLITQLCLAMNNIGTRMDGYDAAEANLVNLGLANINSTLGPFLSTLQQAAQLGFLVGEADGQTNALTVGQNFAMALTNQGASLFTPTEWLTVMDVNDNTNWGVCQLISWLSSNANLTTKCIYATKTQTSTSWQVTCGSGVVPASINAMTSANTSATNAAASATSAANSASSVAGLAAAIQAGPVASVAGKTGAVTLVEGDISGLTADLAARPTTTYVNNQVAGLQPHSATLDQLAALVYSSFIIAFLGANSAAAAMSTLGAAPLASPTFTGAPAGPTPTAGDNSTKLATTAFLAAALAGYQTTTGLAAAVAALPINSSQITAVFDDQTGTTYTFVAADSSKQVTLTNSAAITATLPNNLPKGWNCLVWQGGAGQVAFTPASGATLYNRQSQTHTAGQYAMVSLMVMSNSSGTNAVYVLGGDTA